MGNLDERNQYEYELVRWLDENLLDLFVLAVVVLCVIGVWVYGGEAWDGFMQW